jgi:FkbM family methyltransferase
MHRPGIICEHHLIPSLISKDSIVLDIGANRGKFAKEILSRVNCTVHSIEANPYLAAVIVPMRNLHVYNYAITGHNGDVSLYVSQNPEASSTRGISDATKKIVVPGICLETFISKYSLTPDTLKVDIEGSEVELFESLSENMISKFKQITVEFHDFIGEWNITMQCKDIISKIVNCGFYCIKFSRRSNLDVLFINKNSISKLNCFIIEILYRDLIGGFHKLRKRA